MDGLEVMPDKLRVSLNYDATDDYGITALHLIYTIEGQNPAKQVLKPDDGRASRGSYVWDLSQLNLKPGQLVTYAVEAIDNDAIKGPKTGSSQKLTLKLYSDAEHREEALRKAEALWIRLVDHLADRMESPDRQSPTTLDAAVAGKPNDERATQLGGDMVALVDELRSQRDPPMELLGALNNIYPEINRDVSQAVAQRRFLLRLSGREAQAPGTKGLVDSKDGAYSKQLSKQLAGSIAVDIAHTEKNVLYLEALLDRARMDAVKEIAQQLRKDRQELSRLIDEFTRAPNEETKNALMAQMEALKQRMEELRRRMQELSKGVRDDFVNNEAMQQMQEEFGMDDALSDVEKLMKEGKTEEALKKMQELSMQLDEFLENIENAAEESDQQTDPELSKQFQEFTQKLDETVQKQEQLADKTRALRDKARAQQKDRIAKQGEQLKRELKTKLEALQESWNELDSQRMGYRFEENRKTALQSSDNVKQSLEANDFDLASEAADQMEESAQAMSEQAAQQRRNDELFQNPPEARRESKQASDKLERDSKQAKEIAQKLRDLFPQPGQAMSEQDKQDMGTLAKQQRQLQQQSQELMQRMDALGERAPIFDEEAQQQMQQASDKMSGAADKLQGRDANRGFGDQQGAMQALQGLQQSMKQSQGKGGKGGLPMPGMRGGGSRSGGRGNANEKVEIPDEDPNAAPREFRKDVMDAMKQGSPDRYKEQTRKYYEELVK
jgi:hypothetical protein